MFMDLLRVLGFYVFYLSVPGGLISPNQSIKLQKATVNCIFFLLLIYLSSVISSPTNLQVVKTTTTSAVVQWEKSQGEIDRYRLTVTPRDEAEKIQEMTIPVNQNSAHILQLEAGRLYDIILVAEKGTSQSEPVSTQAVPGE